MSAVNPALRSAPLVQRAPHAGTSTLLAGALFVLLWSTGYIAGKIGLAQAGAFTLLVARFAGATLAFALLALAGRADWPDARGVAHSVVVGILSLALQFGGVYLGVQWGAEIGVAALVIGAMPLLTSALAPWFGESVTLRQWIGLALGLLGVLLVLADRLHIGAAPLGAYLLLVLGLFGISLGTLYQKRFASAGDARAGLAIQHATATVVLLPFAWHEHFAFAPTFALGASLAWLIIVNSVGGFGLLFVLLRRGAANRVAQLFFLIPPVTALLGYVLLGENFTVLKMTGFIVAAAGVYVGTRTLPARRA